MTPKSRLYIPGLSGLYDSLSDWAWLILRVAAGLILAAHGAWKFGYLGGPGLNGVIGFFDKVGYSPGSIWAPTLATFEVVGGILLAIGLLTRPVALIGLIQMLLVAYYHSRFGFWHNVQGGGVEYPLMWAAVMLFFLIRGAGPMSVDARMSKEF
ncbi:MAG: DoxX family protein [Bradyrhizobiaceae bacterium]|nr:DoxX family protein [Bradyrhizobiaceae bacterium]